MFGKNPIRSQEHGQALAVQEVFYTLQGEGPYAGMPALFIRLAGCNLACHFCDTEFESGMGNLYGPNGLMVEMEGRFSPQQRRFVVLTGGEPMRQNFMPLLGLLFATGTELVQIETAGTLWVDGLEKYIEEGPTQRGIREGRVVLVCSPKTPRVHLNVITYCEHWKYIIRAGEQSDADGLPRRGTQVATKNQLSHIYRPIAGVFPHRIDTIWVSPCDDYDEAKNRANREAAVEAALQYGYRLSLQIHKIVRVP